MWLDNQNYFALIKVIVAGASGFYIRGGIQIDIIECAAVNIYKDNNFGMWVEDGHQSVNDVMVEHFFAQSYTHEGSSIGIIIKSCGYISFARPSCLTIGTGMRIAGGASCDIYCGYFDHCGSGFIAEPEIPIMRMTLLKCWASSSLAIGPDVGWGFRIKANPPGTAPGFYGINFIDCVSYDNKQSGFHIGGGEDIKLENCLIAGNSTYAVNGAAGVYVDADTWNLRITNCTIGPVDGMYLLNQGYGIFINGGIACHNLQIVNNRIMDNNLGQITDGSTTVYKVIEGNYQTTVPVLSSVEAGGTLHLGLSQRTVFRVTGSTNIGTILPVWVGRVIHLTFVDANPPNLIGGGGNIMRTFNPAANETIILVCVDGVNWF